MYFKTYDTVIGKIIIEESEEKISRIEIVNGTENFDGKEEETELINKTYKELDEYFRCKRKTFDIPLKIEGTEFQKKFGMHF